jgi:hypothetical protein
MTLRGRWCGRSGGEVEFEFRRSRGRCREKEGEVRAEGVDLLIVEAVFVRQFLDDGEDVLSRAHCVDDAVAGIEEVEFNA